QNAGSSNVPSPGSTAAAGLQRIGRTSIAKVSPSFASPQFGSCSENYAIQHDVFGQTLRGESAEPDVSPIGSLLDPGASRTGTDRGPQPKGWGFAASGSARLSYNGRSRDTFRPRHVSLRRLQSESRQMGSSSRGSTRPICTT